MSHPGIHANQTIHHNLSTKTPQRKTAFPKNPRKNEQIRPPPRANFFPKLTQILRWVSHPKNMKILETALQDIDELVVSIRIGRPQEKTILQHKVPCIADDPSIISPSWK